MLILPMLQLRGKIADQATMWNTTLITSHIRGDVPGCSRCSRWAEQGVQHPVFPSRSGDKSLHVGNWSSLQRLPRYVRISRVTDFDQILAILKAQRELASSAAMDRLNTSIVRRRRVTTVSPD
jgi:hypothetical protein